MNNLNTADDVMAVLFNRHGSPTLEAAVSADTAHAANARWLRNKIQRGELQGEALETARRTIRHLDARAREARDVDYDAVKRVIHRLDREGYTTPKKATTRAIDLYLQEAAGGRVAMSERIDWDALIPNFLDRDVVKVAARAVQLTGGTTRKGIVAGCKAQAEHLRAIAARNRQAATHNRNRASRDDDLAVAHGMEHRATKLEGIANAYA